MPYGASLQNLVFRLRNVQGEQGDWAVKIADVRERTATQESVSLTCVSTAFSQKSCSNLFERDFGIITSAGGSSGCTFHFLCLTPMCPMGGDLGDVE